MDSTLDDANPISVTGLLLLIILDCIFICFGFYQSPPSLLKLLFHLRGAQTGTDHDHLCCTATQKTLIDELDGGGSERSDSKELSIGDVIMVMRRLGPCYDPDEDKLVSNDITAIFEEQEPSLQEVEEAFSMFDENNDGFIDANDLRKILCRLCLTQVSEADCMRMIRTFDDNEDGVIDFHEFVGLVADSFN